MDKLRQEAEPVRSPAVPTPSAANGAAPRPAPGAPRPPPTVPPLPAPSRPYENARPGNADYDAAHLCAGGGVAIFHIATARVVVCHHPRYRTWFLPKGRRDVGETAARGAEREGFEESGYRNRVLPLPFLQLQPAPSTRTFEPGAAALAAAGAPGASAAATDLLSDPAQYTAAAPADTLLSAEPVLTQLMPVTRSRQYVLHWYVAETLPPAAEQALDRATAGLAQAHGLDARRVYVPPPPWPTGLGIRARVAMDGVGGGRVHEPVRHEGTGVDEDEAEYESELVPVAEAVELLGHGMDWVVRWGWEAICALWEKDRRDAEQRGAA